MRPRGAAPAASLERGRQAEPGAHLQGVTPFTLTIICQLCGAAIRQRGGGIQASRFKSSARQEERVRSKRLHRKPGRHGRQTGKRTPVVSREAHRAGRELLDAANGPKTAYCDNVAGPQRCLAEGARGGGRHQRPSRTRAIADQQLVIKVCHELRPADVRGGGWL